jgi:ABC-type nickel/cobalt efflux system permease component RcnA
MEEQWIQYGPLGLVIIALAWFILHERKERKEEKKCEQEERHESQKAWRDELQKITERHETAVRCCCR